jgi:8-oxo-dGTP diphosphatase
VVVAPDSPSGLDGLVNDYFLVRASRFEPHGEFSADQIAAEHIAGFRWWQLSEITAYTGPDLFSPRDLVTPLTDLLTTALPAEPVTLGL